ncbi:MAG: hypothetical protein HFE76_03635 [Firmicutes bacterium]|nr:hypothetical protein [Bacillota bacterium]
MKKRYLILTIILALLFTSIPASAATADGKLRKPESIGLSATLGQKTYNYDAYRYGSYIYYSYRGPSDGKNCTNYIYRMKTDGTKKTLLGKIKKNPSGWVSAVYGNNLIYAPTATGPSTYMTSLNLKTKKTKNIKNFDAFFHSDYAQKKDVLVPYHYKHYFAASRATGAAIARPVWIFNMRTNKPKLISNKGWSIAIKGKKVYYLESSGTNILLRSCSVKGTGKKTLQKRKLDKQNQSVYISSASGKYCIYSVSGKEYKYKY